MTSTPARSVAALSLALALPLALLAAPPPASAATVGVIDWASLQAAFLENGDTVRLDADITAADGEQLLIQPNESIILDLNGRTLTIANPGDENAAISVPSDSTLTIDATGGGTLVATGGLRAAGIGGSPDPGARDGGTVTINGGTVIATGGTVIATGGFDGGAGIGGGPGGGGGTTTINGGASVTATGGSGAAGIGGGGFIGVSRNGGTTIINGGTITATGGRFAAGIGGGLNGFVGVLEVNGTPDGGSASTGGGGINASPITNQLTPPGAGYFATTSTVNEGGRIELRFNYLTTLTLNGGNGTTINGSAIAAPQPINDGDTLTEPLAPTRAGFTFAGWMARGSLYNFADPVTTPLELSARWTEVLPPEQTICLPDETPKLPATGADGAIALSIASLLLAGGVTLIALRRRSTRSPA